MANASAKRIASQNEATVKNLRLGLFLPTVLSFLLRLLFRRNSLPPSKGSLALYLGTLFPAFFLSKYLIQIGTTKRDPTTGSLISYGEDLGQPGLTEWAFDVLYITWACQVGSGAFGEWFWWLYTVIPLFAIYKLWVSVVSPFVLRRGSPSMTDPNLSPAENGTSKRQEKLRKRSEKGDQRARVQARK